MDFVVAGSSHSPLHSTSIDIIVTEELYLLKSVWCIMISHYVRMEAEEGVQCSSACFLWTQYNH